MKYLWEVIDNSLSALSRHIQLLETVLDIHFQMLCSDEFKNWQLKSEGALRVLVY